MKLKSRQLWNIMSALIVLCKRSHLPQSDFLIIRFLCYKKVHELYLVYGLFHIFATDVAFLINSPQHFRRKPSGSKKTVDIIFYIWNLFEAVIYLVLFLPTLSLLNYDYMLCLIGIQMPVDGGRQVTCLWHHVMHMRRYCWQRIAFFGT